MLTRTDFCTLLKVDTDGLKNIVRRGYLPYREELLDKGQYTALEALLAIMAEDEFEQGRSMLAAAKIVGRMAAAVAEELRDIAKTSQDLCDGISVDEIFGVTVELPFGNNPSHVALCGTLAQINKGLGAFPAIVRFTPLNVSRAAAVMRMRASRADIRLGGVWGD